MNKNNNNLDAHNTAPYPEYPTTVRNERSLLNIVLLNRDRATVVVLS